MAKQRDEFAEEREEVEYYERTHGTQTPMPAARKTPHQEELEEVEYYERQHPAEIRAARKRSNPNWEEEEEVEYYERNRPIEVPARGVAQRISDSITRSRTGKAVRSTIGAARSTYDFFSSPPPNRRAPSLHQDNIPYLNRPSVRARSPPPAIRGVDFREPGRIGGIGREPPLSLAPERPFFPFPRRSKPTKSHKRKR